MLFEKRKTIEQLKFSIEFYKKCLQIMCTRKRDVLFKVQIGFKTIEDKCL